MNNKAQREDVRERKSLWQIVKTSAAYLFQLKNCEHYVRVL